MLLFLLFAVLHATILSTTIADVSAWVGTAPGLRDYSGEVDAAGRMVHPFTTPAGGVFTVRCDRATGRVVVRGKLSDATTYAQDKAACQQLADALGVAPAALRVHTVETGVTAPLTAPPTAFLAQVAKAHYGPHLIPFYGTEPPRKTTCPLQYVAHGNEVRVKLYDRGTFAKLKNRPNVGNCLRFELHYLKSRRIGQAMSTKEVRYDGSVTLADIMQPEAYTALATRLRDSWGQIYLPVKTTTTTFPLNVDDLALLVAGQDPQFWADCKPLTQPKTYQRRLRRFRELRKELEQADATNPYTQQVRELIAALEIPQICPVSPTLDSTP